ncbi:MAG: LURP-one-related/scramblase family protein [Flammeovirgaceae bacterium]
MKFIIKEKFWSLADDFYIYNEDQKAVYFVDGNAFSWGDKLSFQDLNGNELAFIHQKMLSWRPCYEITKDGQTVAKVIKEFSWFNKSFTLDVPGSNDYTIEGSFWQHHYRFTRNKHVVATVSKDFWALKDSYGVAIADGEDVVAILCAIIVIDQVLHDDEH